MFGEYGFVLILQNPKKKQAQLGLLVKYLCATDDQHFQVVDPTTGRLFRCRRPNFLLYNPNYDPERLIRPFYPPPERQLPRVNPHHSVRSTASRANKTIKINTPDGSQNAPRKFVNGLTAHLHKHGYTPSPAEANLYRRVTKDGNLYMTTTIDDFTLCTNSHKLYSELLGTLRKYQAKHFGRASHTLGWSIYTTSGNLRRSHITAPPRKSENRTHERA